MSVSWRGVDASLRAGFEALAQTVAEAGGQFVLTSTIRSKGEQSRLYRRYLSGQSGGLPAAPPYHSAHEYGWAFDAVTNPRDWQGDAGHVWTSWGGTWGADKDPVHFELPGAGAQAWAIGEQVDPVGAAGATATVPNTQSTADDGIGLLPPRWRKRIYQAEDIGLGFVPYVGTAQLIATLLSLKYSDSEILKVLQSPVEELHALYPWIPF